MLNRSVRLGRYGLVAVGTLSLLLLICSPALAHERRQVIGKYDFVVGFLNEPAFAGQMNSVDLRVSTHDDKKPVEGLEKTMKVEVIFGGGANTMPMDLKARFNTPGAYNAYFMPTKDGAYIFHFIGTINGDPIDERFESGPNTFGDVEAVAPVQFPAKSSDLVALTSNVQSLQNEINTARMVGLGGMLLGLLGLITAGVALTRRPKLVAESVSATRPVVERRG